MITEPHSAAVVINRLYESTDVEGYAAVLGS